MDQMIQSLALRQESLTAAEILLNLALAFLLGLFVAWVYKHTHRQLTVSFTFVNTLVLLSLIMTLVIMVIGNNIARAFGLAGAMSIIRFRTVVKDTRDTAFVFYSLSTGMACGTSNLVLAVLGTLLIGLFAGVLHWTRHGATGRDAFVLSFDLVPSAGGEGRPQYEEVFARHLHAHSLMSAKSVRLGERVNHTYQVYLQDPEQVTALVEDLSALEGIHRVILSYGEGAEV
jgi:uncharacterized membrane protein YhiD involved in acid resistance